MTWHSCSSFLGRHTLLHGNVHEPGHGIVLHGGLRSIPVGWLLLVHKGAPVAASHAGAAAPD